MICPIRICITSKFTQLGEKDDKLNTDPILNQSAVSTVIGCHSTI